jgi:hypothetical protein
MSIVDLCETKNSGLMLPLSRSRFFYPVTCHSKIAVRIACLPRIACQTDFASDSQTLEAMRKEYRMKLKRTLSRVFSRLM